MSIVDHDLRMKNIQGCKKVIEGLVKNKNSKTLNEPEFFLNSLQDGLKVFKVTTLKI